METGDFTLLKNYSNNNDYLTKIVSELENIITELNSKKKIEIIIPQIKTLITTVNNIIETNKKDFDTVKNFVENMNVPKSLNNDDVVFKTKVYDDGKYVGEFKNELREGKGAMFWFDGVKYEGNWKNDKTEGKGVIYYTDGARYEGDFKNDKVEGRGIMYLSNGSRYEGEFKDGNMDGKGIIYVDNGDREMGDFSNNEKIGKHVMLHSNGKVSTKNWDDKGFD